MTVMLRHGCALAVAMVVLPAATLAAQTPRPLSRRDAHAEALRSAPMLRLAAGDAALAGAMVQEARLLADPTLAVGYSKSVPNYHYVFDMPLPLPWSRAPRIAAAEQGKAGAAWRSAYRRAEVIRDVDAAYTVALAAAAQARLSERGARDADSLVTIARLRFEAGDASALDVDLAAIAAAQQRNLAGRAALAGDDALLALQATMGLVNGAIVVALSDSLTTPDAPEMVSRGTPLLVAAAEADLRATQFAVTASRRERFGTPSLTAGFERGDIDFPGSLPTVGFAIPLPLWNRNRGGIARASAEQTQAEGVVAAARVESITMIARATRAWRSAIDLVARDESLLTAADRVTTKSLTAYREGATTLSSVLEAQRNARDVRAQYIDDLLSAWLARSAVLLLAETTAPDTP